MSASCKIAALALLASSIAWLAPANGQDAPATAKRKLVVSGTATVSAKADKARITFVVTTTDADAKKVRDENNKQVKKIKDALTALNFKNVDIQVVPSAISTVLVPAQGGAGPGQGFGPGGIGGPFNPLPPAENKETHSTFYLTVREKNEDSLRDIVTKLADVASETGGTALQDVSGGGLPPAYYGSGSTHNGPKIEWSSENTGEARREAIKKAMDEALANAQATAGDAKITVVEVEIQVVTGDGTFITDKSSHGLFSPYTPYTYTTYGVSSDSNPSPVTVHVQVTCSY